MNYIFKSEESACFKYKYEILFLPRKDQYYEIRF